MSTYPSAPSLNLNTLVNTYLEPAWILDDTGQVIAMNALAETHYAPKEDRQVLPVKGLLKKSTATMGVSFQMHYHTLSESVPCYLARLLPTHQPILNTHPPAGFDPPHVREDSREDLLKQFIQLIPHPVFVKDRQHRWILFNRAFADFLGQPPEALLLKSDYDFSPKAEADVFWQKDEEVFLTGQMNENEESFTDAQGNTHWILTRKAAFLNENNEPILLGVITDITQQRALSQRLDQARQQAEQANQVKSQFLARMSHELRTPLNAIIGFSQLMKHATPNLNPKEKQYLERIHSNGLHLLHLINELLDISMIESGKLELQSESCNVEALCQELAEVFTPAAEKKGLRFSLTTEPLTLTTDTTRLRQVISNLLQNAVKFTATGGIRLILKAGQSPCIIVEDSGPGIPPHLRDSIFDEFVQAEQGLKNTQEGVGLGLSISKTLSTSLGFQLELNETQQGSRFTLHLALDSSKNL